MIYIKILLKLINNIFFHIYYLSHINIYMKKNILMYNFIKKNIIYILVVLFLFFYYLSYLVLFINFKDYVEHAFILMLLFIIFPILFSFIIYKKITL